MTNKLKKFRSFQKPLLFVIGFAFIGSVLLLLARADSQAPISTIEAEALSRSNVSLKYDNEASNGAFAEFGGGGTSNWTGAGPDPDLKPSNESTGPQEPIVSTYSGTVRYDNSFVLSSGTYENIHFPKGVTITGPVTIKHCTIDGAIRVENGPAVVEHCDINGWFGITSDNRDPELQLATFRHVKAVRNSNDDAIRIGARSTFGDNSVYNNTVIEDSIFEAHYREVPGAHYDLLQFGGGKNVAFNRVVFYYSATEFEGGATSYVNNGVRNQNVTFTDFWVEGGPVSAVFYGTNTVTNCYIESTTKGYFLIYPGDQTTLTNCIDEYGNTVSH